MGQSFLSYKDSNSFESSAVALKHIRRSEAPPLPFVGIPKHQRAKASPQNILAFLLFSWSHSSLVICVGQAIAAQQGKVSYMNTHTTRFNQSKPLEQLHMSDKQSFTAV